MNAVPLTPNGAAQVVAICSAQGSVGRSTISAGLTHALAQLPDRKSGQRLLVDLDTATPSQAILHGRDTVTAGVLGSARLIRQERYTNEEHERLTIRLDEYDLLTGIASMERWPEVDEYSVGLLLHEMARRYQQVVIDLPANLAAVEVDPELGMPRNQATVKVLERADVIVLVTAADPVSLSRTLALIPRLRTFAHASLVIAVNRARNSAIGGNAPRQVHELFAHAGVAASDVYFLPNDPETCDRALLDGRSVSATKPRGALARALRELAARINSSHVHSSRVGQAEWQG